MTVIPVVVGALGTVPKGLEKETERNGNGKRIETIETTAFMKLNYINFIWNNPQDQGREEVEENLRLSKPVIQLRKDCFYIIIFCWLYLIIRFG